jgi:D-alanyl-D-alanine carboxypeptidase
MRVASVVILAALLVIAGVRFWSWRSFGTRTRLLTLVNPWNPVSETGYSARLTEAEEGFQVDRACAEALRQLLSDCRAAGRKPQLSDAYRSVDDQLVLHDDPVQRLVNQGLTPEQAETEASRIIAPAGRSEHELGLAVDIVDSDYPVTDEKQAETPTNLWLRENAWKYGFIERYPPDAEEITGYSWHPWHYRYVGEDVAGSIFSLGITLEEYLSMFYSDEAQVVYDKE